MIPKVLISICVLVFALVVPMLEINESHVFNQEWTPHARFHEVWQLTTNISIGLLCLWLVWFRNQIRMASVLTIMVMGGVLFAHLIEGVYGGSILSGNISKTVLGIETAAFAAIVVVTLACVSIFLDRRNNE